MRVPLRALDSRLWNLLRLKFSDSKALASLFDPLYHVIHAAADLLRLWIYAVAERYE